MRHKEPFTIFPRKTKSGKPIYYFRIYDENGNRTVAHSTGKTTQSAARNYVVDLLKSGNAQPKKNPKFKEYTQDWWRWDKCPYILGKRARGRRISQSYVTACRGYLEHHILPGLGEYRIQALTPKIIEQWLMNLRNKESKYGTPLSATTVNQVLMTLKLMFREGMRVGDLMRDPTATIDPLMENRKVKSFLNPEEIRRLFDENKIRETWQGDLRHYTINLLAASTGMRLGECQALQRQFVFAGYVEIRHGWARKYGLKEEPKYGSKRMIPIPQVTQFHLSELMLLAPYQEPADYVFWGASRERPVNQKEVQVCLYEAFAKVGIPEEERKQRNITFHSWRHFFNSFMRGKVPDAKLQRLTGHRTIEMTEHYTTFKIEDFKDVARIQNNFFGEKENGK